MTNQRWETALHESGHGVAAYLLGGRVQRLVVYDDAIAHDGMSGQTFGRGSLAPEHRALVMLCGPATEHKFGYRYVEAGRGDIAAAERILTGSGLRVKHIWPRALRLIDLYKPRIKLVAREMHRTGSLNGQDLAKLMRYRLPPWQSSRW